MSGFVPALGWTLLHFLWQGLLIGCATALARAVLRNARPEARYAVGCGALLACLAWPAAGLYLRLDGGEATAALFSATLLPAALLVPDSLPDLDLALRAIVGIWALCAAMLALRMALGMLWIGRSASKNGATHALWQTRLASMAQDAGVTRPVRLRVLDGIASPLTAGIWRPMVLVPAALITGMPPHLLEALLAHELAHIRRHDYLLNLLQNAIEALLFFHPAVWWISRGVRLEREHIADDFAARQLGEPRRLALALSELERLQFSTHHLAQAANGGDLMSRIKRLLRPAPQTLNWKAAVPLLALAGACLGIYGQAVAADSAPAADRQAVADFATCSKPVYPAASRQAKEAGTVNLSLDIDANGKVLASKLVRSSGHPALDEAARSGIAKCIFKPALAGGKPVSSTVPFQYVWSLK
ncbi:M56 family metallopeptidase [Janthinobacterium sp. SUN118]|uniref:M56 family metallopeptidase n=1 Tax=Janthinobacterium sp. SUN118 TaxID=3004100 RepID=UPI0025AFEF71|nr:M56 family metallopeptidase [Janthinobacterium sp. SUN118]MDN2712833.1 M56 family metallopeptidase [Janthinobacterium sp. SUN118]